jgi:NADH:ubiquinone oxidoreductase subunit 6 (subunit J)
MDRLTDFVGAFWPILLPSLLGLAGVYLLMPRARRYPPLYGAVCCGVALAAAAFFLVRTEAGVVEAGLFYAFSGMAIVSGALMIIFRNPVHSALAFALVVLSTCGLFLLNAAPFLMAATIIIYAGAIIVTFLFVIMLAQQAGASDADQRTREPFLACVGGFVLLGCILAVLQRNYDTAPLAEYLNRVELALQQETVPEMDKALGGPALDAKKDRGHKKFIKDFGEFLTGGEGEAARKPERFAGTRLERAKLSADLRNLEPVFSENPPDKTKVVEQLKEIRKLGAKVRVQVGGLRLDDKRFDDKKKKTLSEFSGDPPTKPVPIDDYGYVKERLPADNVAGLGRTLFSDYLLPLELAGVLLLVATIGAIVIAGRRTEGLR